MNLYGATNLLTGQSRKQIRRAVKQIRKACKRHSKSKRPESNVYFQLLLKLTAHTGRKDRP